MIAVFGAQTKDSAITIIVDADTKEDFKEMVNRAVNLWPNAPPVIKEFADRVTVGVVQQNYYEQNKDLQRVKATEIAKKLELTI